jgi:hypothetical protein
MDTIHTLFKQIHIAAVTGEMALMLGGPLIHIF